MPLVPWQGPMEHDISLYLEKVREPEATQCYVFSHHNTSNIDIRCDWRHVLTITIYIIPTCHFNYPFHSKGSSRCIWSTRTGSNPRSRRPAMMRGKAAMVGKGRSNRRQASDDSLPSCNTMIDPGPRSGDSNTLRTTSSAVVTGHPLYSNFQSSPETSASTT
jgi:hypothetical protein